MQHHTGSIRTISTGTSYGSGVTAEAVYRNSYDTPESHEVSYSLYICIAHYDEYLESKFYKVAPFGNPKSVKKVDAASI